MIKTDSFTHMYLYLLLEKHSIEINFSNVQKILECIEKLDKKYDTDDIIKCIEEKYTSFRYTYSTWEKDHVLNMVTSKGVVKLTPGFTQILDMENERQDALTSIRHMSLNVTGARKGDRLIGVHNISKGAVIQVSDGMIPPSKRDLDNTRLFPDLWEIFLKKLARIPFFENINIDAWLLENEKDGDFDIAETNVKIEVLDVGNSTFTKIDPEVLSTLLTDGPQNAMDMRDYFPKKPGSNARRHTLIFLIYFWKLLLEQTIKSSYDGLTFSFETGKFQQGGKNVNVFDQDLDTEFGIILPAVTSGVNYTASCVIASPMQYKQILLDEKLVTDDNYNNLAKATNIFTAAGFKSLLQKIIRYTPKNVLLPDGTSMKSDQALRITFTLLLTHPGSFVPDIQRFVSGQESAAKRLAVSILEDSYIERSENLLLLMILAFLFQRSPGYKISKELFLKLINICDQALENTTTFHWNIERGSKIKPYVLDIKNTSLANVSALLDMIKSFETDIFMVRDIAFHTKIEKTNIITRPKFMKLEHAIDQHWAPEIAYFFENIPSDATSTKPFSFLFKSIWYNSSCINPRRPVEIDEKIKFQIEQAQKLTYLARLPSTILNQEPLRKYNLEVKLDESWIAGLVGPIQVFGKPPAMVTLVPDNPRQLVAIRKPSRGMKDGTLTEARQEEALAEAKVILQTKGIYLGSIIDPPLPEMKKYKIKLGSDGNYYFESGGNEKTWDELTHKVISIDVYPDVVTEKDNVETWITSSFVDGIREKAFTKFKSFTKLQDVNVLRRVLNYISTCSSTFEVARLSKDGGGTQYTPLLTDSGAIKILWYVTYLFPIALKRVSGSATKFQVGLAPLFWRIRDIIKEYLVNENASDPKSVWPPIKDKTRTPRPYQQECLQEMINKNKKGDKNHFLYLNIGMGKTFIVLSYLKYLQTKGKLPKYIVYTLPSSAISSIITEIENFNIPINLLLPIKSWKKHALVEYSKSQNALLEGHINLIEHDHLRLIENTLTSLASEFIIVIDEIHKALNDTKRTSVALQISRLAIEFIALTGTPTVDTNTYKLIFWLAQVVNFEVNEKNFWTAANGMIAKKLTTGIEIDKLNILADWKDKQAYENYQKLVPINLGGKNSQSTQQDIMKAIQECYKNCDMEMINQTLDFLKKNIRVMLVGNNADHCSLLKEKLVKNGVSASKIFILEGSKSIFLSTEAVKKKLVPNYQVAIVPFRKSEGYTLTHMSAMVSSVILSNAANREQLEGRINRISQTSKIVYYRVIHCGILTFILQKHMDCDSINKVLSAIADEIDIHDISN